MTNKKPVVLIVDDEEHMCLLLQEVLSAMAVEHLTAHDGLEALKIHEETEIAVTILDVKMPRMSGLDVLKKIMSQNPSAKVIILTAFATIPMAVEAMRLGAFNYLTKPFDIEDVERVVNESLTAWSIETENAHIMQLAEELSTGEFFIGQDHKMKTIYHLVDKVAPSDYSVLISGESGTGKSVLAKYIHQKSPRSTGPFVCVNCAAIPETLVESELFGYEKGAFTGAMQRKVGKIEKAHGGTLFLDEISTLKPTAQASLLHVLQDRVFERVGGVETISVDIRVVAASNQDLESLVKANSFREDLYFRLNVFPIKLPPLRERKDDILPLACILLQRLSPEQPVSLSAEAMMLIKSYPWPGNIRELENVLKKALVLASGSQIQAEHLPFELGNLFTALNNSETAAQVKGLKERLVDYEKIIIEQTLMANDWDIAKVAKELKIPTRTLYYHINKLNITLH